MKNRIKFTTAALVLLASSSSAFSQATASATASATIVTPISITKDVDMNFGNLAVSATTAGTAILTTAGAVSGTLGVTPTVTTPGPVAAASFTVTGEDGYTYAITLPATAHTITSGANTMTVTAFVSNPAATGSGTLAGGTQTLNVGATLNVAAGQPAGLYVSTTPFDVTVNYN